MYKSKVNSMYKAYSFCKSKVNSMYKVYCKCKVYLICKVRKVKAKNVVVSSRTNQIMNI